MAKRPKRSEVPAHLTWNLEGLYPTVGAWEADLARVEARLPDMAAARGTLNSAGALLAALQRRDEILEVFYRAAWYGARRSDEDQGDHERSALADRARTAGARLAAAMAWIDPEILALPEGRVEAYLAENEGLELYRFELEDTLSRRPHVLSPDVEQALGSLSELLQLPQTVYTQTANADVQMEPVTDERGQQVPMSVPALQRLLQSADRDVRRAAFFSATEGFDRHKRTLAATFAGAMKRDVITARLRGYETSLHQAMEPVHIPTAVYHNLLATALAGAGSMRRYLELRRRKLGLERLERWDLQVSLEPDTSPDLSYDQAKPLITAALAPLGDEYAAVLETAMNGRWVDLADNEGKRSGAYSANAYGFHPVILMTWQDRWQDAFTLAHELGHTLHSHLASANQPFVYHGYTLFCAEVASTTNEVLLARHVLNTTDDPAMRRFVAYRLVQSYMGNLFGGAIGAEFQLRAHQMVEAGEPLTYESLQAAWLETQRKYYGDTLVLTGDYPANQWTWNLHPYRNYYYYQYATGISAGTALATGILTEGAPAVERYLDFLRAGGSRHSIDLLQDAGVDMTSPEPIRKAIAYFDSLVDELQ